MTFLHGIYKMKEVKRQRKRGVHSTPLTERTVHRVQDRPKKELWKVALEPEY